ncbi:MAG: monovalent cation/H+ antiporter subunit E [Haloferacaceae archaeon]
MTSPRDVLLPVSPSPSLVAAVEFAVEAATRGDGPTTLHLVRAAPRGWGTDGESTREPLDRAARRARETAPESVRVTTAVLASDRYLASPSDHADAIADYGDDHGVELVILDPNHAIDATAPTLQPIEAALKSAGVRYRIAPEGDARGLREGELVRAAAIFAVGYAFYLLVGDPTSAFDRITGAATALAAAALLRNVAFETTPVPGRALRTVARGAIFVPYLLFEIAKANVQFAYVVLHPALPIDPRIDRIDAALGDGLSVTGLANSLTLTPGTLTVDAADSELLVHSLTPDTRADLLDGGRERAVRFVFRGRAGARIPGPLDRGDVDPVATPGSEDGTDPGQTATEGDAPSKPKGEGTDG